MRGIIAATFLLFALYSAAQTDTTEKIYTYVEQMPEFPGGDSALFHFIQKNINYPKEEQLKEIQGKVLLRFVIDTDGAVQNVKVIRAISPGLDEEAVRVVKLLPKFKPGTQQNKPVKVYFNLPVSYSIKKIALTNVRPDSSSSKPLNTLDDSIYLYTEPHPEFPGGDNALMQFMQENIQYPAYEMAHDMQGTVIVRFVIDVDGSVTNPKIMQSVTSHIDMEVIRVLKLLPKFKPGYKDGKPVKVYFKLPVPFRLQH